ncbi:MAG: hypothetical protein JW751_17460 [Polyangiaceae bacterium]|nr:hypothetical protein [Polyangiaceae bacterium]
MSGTGSVSLAGVLSGLSTLMLVGCARHAVEAADTPRPNRAPPAASSHQEVQAKAEPRPSTPVRALPQRCADQASPCYPPAEFVEELCRGKYPAVAILMFRKDQPWAHVYVKVNEVFPRNHFAGPVTHVPLAFSEELVLLKHRPYLARAGYDIDYPDSFDVLRMSGTCAVVAEDEIRDHWAGPSSYAPLVWTWLEPGFRQALSGNDRIATARDKQEVSCAGRYIGGGSQDCQKASVGLVKAIMTEVDAGLSLPSPQTLPEWVPRAD